MILLVFEGVKEEPKIMQTVKELFFKDNPDMVQCAYGSDTHTFVKEVKELQEDDGEVDIFNVVKSRMNRRGDTSLNDFISSQFEATYLFFDYDPQNKTVSLSRLNEEISEIIDVLSDSSENGMIFISYPMVESLYCLNSTSDPNFCNYTVSIDHLHKGKSWAMEYDFYRKRHNVILKTDNLGNIEEKDNTPERVSSLKEIWNDLILVNTSKANFICNDKYTPPRHIEDITTKGIFKKQLEKYVLKDKNVPVLSAFPLFLFEYFHGNGDF